MHGLRDIADRVTDSRSHTAGPHLSADRHFGSYEPAQLNNASITDHTGIARETPLQTETQRARKTRGTATVMVRHA